MAISTPRPRPTAIDWSMQTKFVPIKNGMVALVPKAPPEAANKIFAGPGLTDKGASAKIHVTAKSVLI